MRKVDRNQIMALLGESDLPGSPVNSVADIVADPHVQFREDLVWVTNARGERVRMPTVFPRLKSNPDGIRWAGEELGASNDDVYLGLLKLPVAEYERLKAEQVI